MTAEVLSERDGMKLLDWLRENPSLADVDPGRVEVLVSTRPYTGRLDPVWVPVQRVVAGNAAPYPVRGFIPGAGAGQWSRREILAVRAVPAVLAEAGVG